MTMHATLAHAPSPMPWLRLRKAERSDIGALLALEHKAFATDRLSRRSLERLIASPSAEVIVAEHRRDLAGMAIVLFRRGSTIARLYSIAVAPHAGGRGVAPMLLEEAEQAALAHGARLMRLEVHERNHAAICGTARAATANSAGNAAITRTGPTLYGSRSDSCYAAQPSARPALCPSDD